MNARLTWINIVQQWNRAKGEFLTASRKTKRSPHQTALKRSKTLRNNMMNRRTLQNERPKKAPPVRLLYIRAALLVLSLISALTIARADSTPANPSALLPEPWEKFSVSLGTFLSNTESSVRLGSGLGLDLNIEDVLGLETKTSVLRAETFWRFSHNRRHRLDASWFALRRTANRTLGEDFDIKDSDGNTVTIQAGSNIESHFNLDIIQAAYSYSFIQDDRLDLAAVGGFYIMPINFGLTATRVTTAEKNLKFTAPLPVVGLRLDVALTPKWYLRTGSQFFYVEYGSFTGKLTELRAAVEFLPVKHFGVGLGVDSMRFRLAANSEDYPNINLNGKVELEYTGLQLYGKLRF
jgi:hypothetical protein